MNTILQDLRSDLIKNSNEKDRLAAKRFFKEEVDLLGMKASVVAMISKQHYTGISEKSKDSIFRLCDELFSSGIMEESFVACHWSYNVHKDYLPEDLGIFEQWVNRYVTNWAMCDTLCNHTVGKLLEMYPELIADLKKWALSGNRWVKRASAVSLIIPAKKGMFLKDVFEIADILLKDTDDMVQKGYGWMLKVASQAHVNEVFDFILERKQEMPRTALRYAIEKMPPELKREAMKRN